MNTPPSGLPGSQPVEQEFTIDELARESGTTVRNVRAYQERGLLPPPDRRGRTAIYCQAHVARLRVIARMLERGYSLGNVGELIEAWERGHDIGTLLGLEAALTTPWSSEQPTELTGQQLKELFPDGLPPEAAARYMELGIVEFTEQGNFKVASMKLLQIGSMLSRAGVPPAELLDVVTQMRADVERNAAALIQLIVRHVFDPLGPDRLPPAEQAPRLAELIWNLRPMAVQAMDSEVTRALELAMNRFLGDRLAQILQHLAAARPPA